MQAKLSFKNNFSILMICMVTSNMVVGFPPQLGQDIWIAILISLVFFIPLALMRGRMINIMPDMNLYDMATYSLGNVAGKIVSVIFGLYCLFMVSIVTYSFTEFIHLTALYKTPSTLIILLFLLSSLHLALKGIKVIGQWSTIAVFVTLIVLVFVTISSLPRANFDNLLPIGNHSIGQILDGSSRLSGVPFGEVAIAMSFAHRMQKGKTAYATQIFSIILATLYLCILSLRNCAVLSPELLQTTLFQNYKAVSLIKISDFFERIEAVVTLVYILTSISYIALFLCSAAKSAKKVLNLSNSKGSLIPLAALALCMSIAPFNNIIDMFDFVHVYDWFSFIPQLAIPLAIWIGGEIKYRKNRKNNPLSSIESGLQKLEKSASSLQSTT